MGDETRLGAAGAVAEAEDDHRQVVVAHEPRDAVVDGGHGEQRAGPLHGLHAARGDEADHRQVLFGAGHQELAELLGAGHVERAGLELQVGDHRADLEPTLAVLEPADAGDHAARRHALLQRSLDGHPKAREAVRIGTHEVAVQFLEFAEETIYKRLIACSFRTLVTLQGLADEEIAVGLDQAVPEVLAATDVARRDATVVALAFPFRLQIRPQESLEQERDDHEERIRDVREGTFLPLLHVAEEAVGTGHPGGARVPVEELGAEPLGVGIDRKILRRLGQRRVDEAAQGGPGQGAARLRLAGDQLQVGDDVVVDLVEQQVVLAFAREVRAQFLPQHHVDDGHVGRRRLAGGCVGPLDAGTEAVVQDEAVGDDRRRLAVDRLAGTRRQHALDGQIGERTFRDGHVEFRSKLLAQVRIGLVGDVAEELHAFVGEPLPQHRPEQFVLANRFDQGARFHQFGHPDQVPGLGHVLGERLECPEVGRRIAFPAVVEVHADGGDQRAAGILEVLAPFAEQELRDPPPRIVDGRLLLDVVLPGPRQGVVVDDPVRVLKPTQERLPPLAVRAHVEFPGRQFLLREPPVGLGRGRLDAPAHP